MYPRSIPLSFAVSTLILIATSAIAQNNFTSTSYAAPAAQHIRAVDLNNDGYADLVLFGDYFADPYGATSPGTPLAIMLNNGKGGFSSATVIQQSGYVTVAAAIGDLNGDGLPDIAACTQPVGNGVNSLDIYLNQGSGKFALAHTIATPLGCETIAIGDANQDGKPDIAVATVDSGFKNEDSNNVTTFFGDGTGNFPTLVVQGYNLDGSRPDLLCGIFRAAGADFNGDGILDLVIVVDCQSLNDESNVFLLTGDGTGTYTATELFESTDNLAVDEPNVTDVNGDGQPDVILVGQQSPATNENIGDLNFLINQGGGKFNNVNLFHIESNSSQYADHVYAGTAGNLSSSPYFDAVVAYTDNGQPNLAVLDGTNNSGGYGSPVVLSPAPSGTPLSLAAADYNLSGLDGFAVLEQSSSGVNSIVVYTNSSASTCAPPSTPGVNVCSPTPNADVSSPVNFVAAGTGASGSVNHLELWIDNAKIGNYTGAEMNTSVTVATGTHQATVVEVDSSGNYVKSTPVNFTVGGSTCPPPSAPGVNVCSPTPNSDVSSPVTFIAAGTGASGTVNHLELWIDNTKIGNYTGAEMNTSVSLAAGSHQATVVEVDSSGNYVKSTPVNFTVGASSCTPPSAPGVNVCSPTPNADVSSPVTFIAAGTGASGTVNHLELWIDNGKIGNYTGAEMNTSVSVAAGSHQVTVVEVDSKGNYVKSTPVNFTVN
jgi:phage tail tube protein FII